MASTSDVVAEHAALTQEAAALRRLILAEFATMTHQVATARGARLSWIDHRLATIERSQAWLRRTRGDDA